jgi:catechol 2,3-dioxygenase-like lactoylglutathione lyase family enzyme
MSETVRYWRDLVGFPILGRLGGPGYRQYYFAAGERDMITFFEWPGVEPVPEKDHGAPVLGPIVFDHVSFEVADEDALWGLRDRLEAAGFWVSEVMDHGFMRSIYSFDPNGLPVEFSLAVPALDIRERPLLADRDPPAAALEGEAPRAGVWPAPARPTPAAERVVYPGAGSEYFHGRKKA